MVSIVSVFPPYRGGISTFSDYLYRNLKELTDVRAFNFSQLYPKLIFPGKTQFDISKMETKYADRVLHSWNPFNWKKAGERIIASNPDKVIICYWHPFFAPAFLRVIRLIRHKSPSTTIHLLAHNVLPHERFPLGEMLSGKLINSVDKVILLSQKSLDEINTLNPSSKISVLFHPVYEQDFPSESKKELREKYGFEESAYIPLFFGLIRPYKGLDLFIDALNKLNFEEHHIRPLIAGEFYTDKAPLLNRIEPQQKKMYTIIDRFVSDEEMAELFTLSDVLVMPYRSATQSGILANAINFKLPSIVTNLKGLTEHVEHKKTAWITSKEDIAELSHSITTLSNADVRNSIQEGLNPLKEQLSWESFSRQLLSEISKENR